MLAIVIVISSNHKNSNNNNNNSNSNNSSSSSSSSNSNNNKLGAGFHEAAPGFAESGTCVGGCFIGGGFKIPYQLFLKQHGKQHCCNTDNLQSNVCV